jgi:hypothetical protein
MKNNYFAIVVFAVFIIIVSAFSFTGCAQSEQTPPILDPSVSEPSTEETNATGTVSIEPGDNLATEPTDEPADDFAIEPADAQAETDTTVDGIKTGMIKLYFIELGTKDLKAYRIGCGDAVIGVDAKYAPVKDEKAAETALKMLFAVKNETYGDDKLFNSLYQSNLKVESLTVDKNKKATLKLSGSFNISGVCDTPRFEEQIRQTVLQFKDLYSDVEIFLNDKPLSVYLSGKGEEPAVKTTSSQEATT